MAEKLAASSVRFPLVDYENDNPYLFLYSLKKK